MKVGGSPWVTNVNWNRHKVSDLLSRRRIDLKDDVALMVEVGSTMHGISIDGIDDLDLTAVRFEKWHEFVNGPSSRQSMMVRTQPDGARSNFGDIDINVYTLRKFAMLATKGNPSILAVLFAPGRWRGRYSWIGWDALIGYTTSQAAGNAFLGYMRQQIERWTGQRGQRNVNRPELVEAHGYDTKYAAHAIRLGYQGIEYLTTGRITLPIPDSPRELLVAIRKGEYAEHEALNEAVAVEERLKQALDASPLPDSPNVEGAQMWVADNYWHRFAEEAT